MALTLREQHAVRRARRINEASRAISRRLTEELVVRKLVVEALDAEKLEQASSVLQKLQSIDFGDMAYFKQAVATVVGDVNKALGGNASKEHMAGALGKLLGAAKDKLSSVVKNPIPNALAFTSALENAFAQAARLITSSIPRDTLQSMDKEKLKGITVKKLLGQNANSVHNAIAKAFQPKGILARLGATWQKRYVDPSEAAWAIVNARLGNVINVVKSLRQGPQANSLADELSGASQEDNGEDRPGNQQHAGDDQGHGENMDQDARDELVNKLSAITNVGSSDVEKVVNTLAQRGMLRVKK